MLRDARRKATLLFSVPLLLATATVNAQIFVKADASGGNNGSSWDDAYNDLQNALSAAVSGQEIWVATGTYTPHPSDPTISFDLPAGVALYGGFAGGESARSERDWTANPTVLSGEIGAPDSTDNSYHVVTVTGGGSDTVLDGFTVTRGIGDPVTRVAGGMLIENSSVTVAHVVFDGNSAMQLGGGVYIDMGSPTFTAVEFVRNTAGSQIGSTTHTGYGGGVHLLHGTPSFDGCTFDTNAALFGGQGGGFRSVYGETATFTGCTFDGNIAEGINGGDVVVDSCTFVNNTRRGLYAASGTVTNCTAAYNGGGISVASGTIAGCTAEFNNGSSGFGIVQGSITDCVSRYNTGGQGGGVAISSSGTATVSGCLFLGNTATSGGGGGYAASTSSASFVGCTFADNVSTWDGGGVLAGIYATATNCVFIHNSAGRNGGGWYQSGACLGRLTNVTFVDNAAAGVGSEISGCPDIYNAIVSPTGFDPIDRDPTFYSSLVEGSGGSGAPWNTNFGIDGGGNIDAPPALVDASGGDAHLSVGSPAIDAGDDAAPGVTATDLDGNARIAGAAIDMGAFEFHCPAGPRLYVDAAASGAATGDSWTDALPTLQGALARACTTVTEIWVAEGTYMPTAGDDRAATFRMHSGVAVYGGFAGGEASLSERDIGAHTTVLSGAIGSSSEDDNSLHVVTSSAADPSAVLDGFVVTHGRATGAYPDDRGGGMLVNLGSSTVRNVSFVDNSGLSGGAMANIIATVELTNIVFYHNSALSGPGGAVSNTSSNATFTNVTIHDNSAAAGGGGVYNASGSPVFVNVIVWGNSGTDLVNGGTSPLISYSLIDGSGGSSGWVTSFGTDGGGNIDADPQFVDAAGGDLRLDTGSPAIDAGDDSAPNLLAIDLDGNPRVDGTAVDMGAYERPVATAADNTPRPAATALRSAYPNPFNPSVTIAFDLERNGPVDISVYDVRGALVRRLVTGSLSAGPHRTRWDGRGEHGARVASGVYIVRLESRGTVDRRKVVLLK